jgi:hypothetical protein
MAWHLSIETTLPLFMSMNAGSDNYIARLITHTHTHTHTHTRARACAGCNH